MFNASCREAGEQIPEDTTELDQVDSEPSSSGVFSASGDVTVSDDVTASDDDNVTASDDFTAEVSDVLTDIMAGHDAILRYHQGEMLVGHEHNPL